MPLPAQVKSALPKVPGSFPAGAEPCLPEGSPEGGEGPLPPTDAGGTLPPLTLCSHQGPSPEVSRWETGDPAPLHGQALLFNSPFLCLLECLRWDGWCPWGVMEATKPWAGVCRPSPTLQGPVRTSRYGRHENPGEGDSPCALGKAGNHISAMFSPCPALPRAVWSGINLVLRIWPVCHCVQSHQHWQGCLEDLKCFSLAGISWWGPWDRWAFPSLRGGSCRQTWLWRGGCGFPTPSC